MTLIIAYKGDGQCVGRCSAKCHDAKEPHCDCICHGAYHGLGTRTPKLQQAVEEHFQDVAEALRAAGLRIETSEEVAQRRLF
jgi:hypothetical protein